MLVIVRLDRTIQYSEASVMESRTRGVLDTRLRGYDGGGWSIFINVIARSVRDEAIRFFPCSFWIASLRSQ